jgi:hypothetical protein
MKDMNSKGKNQTDAKDTITQNNKPPTTRLLSRLGTRYWIQLALVILLLLAAVVATLIDTKKCNTRDSAFVKISAAEKTDDFIGIIQGAERFFSVNPMTRKDERELYVKELYDKAIIRLFIEQTKKPDPNALKHFKQYRHLIVDQGK